MIQMSPSLSHHSNIPLSGFTANPISTQQQYFLNNLHHPSRPSSIRKGHLRQTVLPQRRRIIQHYPLHLFVIEPLKLFITITKHHILQPLHTLHTYSFVSIPHGIHQIDKLNAIDKREVVLIENFRELVIV